MSESFRMRVSLRTLAVAVAALLTIAAQASAQSVVSTPSPKTLYKTGPTRVAWTIVNRQLPVVQCVEVQRTGSVLTGRGISLRRLSVPIDSTGSC